MRQGVEKICSPLPTVQAEIEEVMREKRGPQIIYYSIVSRELPANRDASARGDVLLV